MLTGKCNCRRHLVMYVCASLLSEPDSRQPPTSGRAVDFVAVLPRDVCRLIFGLLGAQTVYGGLPPKPHLSGAGWIAAA